MCVCVSVCNCDCVFVCVMMVLCGVTGDVYGGGCQVLPGGASAGAGPSPYTGDCLQGPQTREVSKW